MSGTFNEIRIQCKLTEQQYREYMRYHVLGNRKDLFRHSLLCLLMLSFGGINFAAASPILGWIFVTLGIYLFLSRLIRFYMSVNRIVSQYGLGKEARFFYWLSFREKDFMVRNTKEKAVYGYERIVKAVFRKKERIAYLYLTPSTAFLLPYDGLESGTIEDLREMLREKCPSELVTDLE